MDLEYRNRMSNTLYTGEKTSIEYRNGPKKTRGFTDCLMLIIFLIAWGGFIYLSIYGLQNGTPTKVYKPYDSMGSQCGENNASAYPYLYWVNPISNLTQTICVNECPYINQTVNGSDGKSYQDNYGNTQQLVGLCIPGVFDTINNITSLLGIGTIQKSMADIISIWYMLLIIAGIALIISFIYTILMRFCSGIMTWGILLLYVIFLGLLGYFCLNEAHNPGSSGEISNILDYFSTTSLNIIAYISFIILGISLLLICLFFHKIELSIAVLKCAAQFVQDVPTILAVPPLFFVVLIAYTGFWLYSLACIISLNNILPTQYPFPLIEWITPYQYEAIYFIFIYLWNYAFFLTLPQFIIASSCVCWYFRVAHGGKLGHPVLWSLCNNMVKHLGSVALGSLIIAIVNAIKLVMNYVHEKLKPLAEENMIGFCFKCVVCCLNCFERFIRFINSHAFIQIAMTGESFCKAAHDSFYLIIRYAGNLAIAHGMGEIFVFVGTVCVTVASSVLGYFALTETALNQKIFSPVFPTLVFAVISYVVGSNFMSVFGTSADTIVHCYCMDDEMHKDMNGARYAPEILSTFIKNHKPSKPLHQRLLSSKGGNNT